MDSINFPNKLLTWKEGALREWRDRVHISLGPPPLTDVSPLHPRNSSTQSQISDQRNIAVCQLDQLYSQIKGQAADMPDQQYMIALQLMPNVSQSYEF